MYTVIDLDKYTVKTNSDTERSQYILHFMKEQNISKATILRKSYPSQDYLGTTPGDNNWNLIPGSVVNLNLLKEERDIELQRVTDVLISKTEAASPYFLNFIRRSDCHNCYEIYLVNKVNASEVYIIDVPPIPDYQTVSSLSALKIFLYPLTIAADIGTSPIQFVLAMKELSTAH
ncbi:hypothetical protein [Geotalea uraniireducens]|uniref:hypothetical protein n=1 Tax=Geotalea uraniireducens TaxID=351604 RepID=UPI00059B90FB|nr:hypothetical protein [Geotalea uraniireducens]